MLNIKLVQNNALTVSRRLKSRSTWGTNYLFNCLLTISTNETSKLYIAGYIFRGIYGWHDGSRCIGVTKYIIENSYHTQSSIVGFPEHILIARFMGPTWGLSGAERTHVGPMLAPWNLLSSHWWKVLIFRVVNMNKLLNRQSECRWLRWYDGWCHCVDSKDPGNRLDIDPKLSCRINVKSMSISEGLCYHGVMVLVVTFLQWRCIGYIASQIRSNSTVCGTTCLW